MLRSLCRNNPSAVDLIRWRLWYGRLSTHNQSGPTASQKEEDVRIWCRSLCTERQTDSAASQKEEDICLWACYREQGPGITTALRKAGMVPGLITDHNIKTGKSSNQRISLQRQEVWKYWTLMGRKGFAARFYLLDIHPSPDSEEVVERIRVFPEKLTLINGYRSIKCVAFVIPKEGVKLKLDVPFKFRGRSVCPGLKAGGTLVVYRKSVQCYCLFEEMPSFIEVDVSKLKIGDSIRLEHLDVDLQFQGQARSTICEIIWREA